MLQHWKPASPTMPQTYYPCYPYTLRAQARFVEGMKERNDLEEGGDLVKLPM